MSPILFKARKIKAIPNFADRSMARHFLHISYLGTAFHGWQIQENAHSIQQEIETAMNTVLRQERVAITGCGRTDTGVHATEFYAHFDAELDLDAVDYVFKFNGLLPNDIAIHQIIPVSDDAHARFDAKNRQYTYRFHKGKQPFLNHFSSRISQDLDLDLMNKAGEILMEHSDFTSFAKVHSDSKTNICAVSKCEWSQLDGQMTLLIEADRFLRNMVRSIVGTMVDVGKGKTNLKDFRDIIEAKDRRSAGVSAPAVGLALSAIEYPYIDRA